MIVKSGLLFPSFGHSGNNGYQLDVPYYFNLAPNYDATLTPGYLSKRGVHSAANFAILTAGSRGQLEENFLPNDASENSDRSYLHLPTSPVSPRACASIRTSPR